MIIEFHLSFDPVEVGEYSVLWGRGGSYELLDLIVIPKLHVLVPLYRKLHI